MSVFDKLILPTHASCHVQFLLFYLCSFRLVSRQARASVCAYRLAVLCRHVTRSPSPAQGLAEAFLEHLWKLLQSPSQPAVLRHAAAGYIGSFLARAKFVPVV